MPRKLSAMRKPPAEEQAQWTAMSAMWKTRRYHEISHPTAHEFRRS